MMLGGRIPQDLLLIQRRSRQEAAVSRLHYLEVRIGSDVFRSFVYRFVDEFHSCLHSNALFSRDFPILFNHDSMMVTFSR